jgi:hypothetical protein
MGGGGSKQSLSAEAINDIVSNVIIKSNAQCIGPVTLSNDIATTFKACNTAVVDGNTQTNVAAIQANCTLNTLTDAQLANQIQAALNQKLTSTQDGAMAALTSLTGRQDNQNIKTRLTSIVKNNVDMEQASVCIQNTVAQNNMDASFADSDVCKFINNLQQNDLNIVGTCLQNQKAYTQAVTDLVSDVNVDADSELDGIFGFLQKYMPYIIGAVVIIAAAMIFMGYRHHKNRRNNEGLLDALNMGAVDREHVNQWASASQALGLSDGTVGQLFQRAGNGPAAPAPTMSTKSSKGGIGGLLGAAMNVAKTAGKTVAENPELLAMLV